MINDWMPTLASVIAEIDGLAVYHPGNQPGTLMEFPCVVISLSTGKADYSAGGQNTTMHYIKVVIFTAAQLLPESQGVAIPLIDAIKRHLAKNMNLGLPSWFHHILPAKGLNFYEGPGGIEYGGKVHTGVILNYEIKEAEAFPVSVRSA